LSDDLNLNEFINEWHREKAIGKIYEEDDGYVFQNTVLLPNATEELLKINIGVFDRSASNLLDEIDEHLTNISLPERETEQDINTNWFKARIEVCFFAERACEEFEDAFGPYETFAKCQERAKEMMIAVRKLIGDGEFGYKCEQSENSV